MTDRSLAETLTQLAERLFKDASRGLVMQMFVQDVALLREAASELRAAAARVGERSAPKQGPSAALDQTDADNYYLATENRRWRKALEEIAADAEAALAALAPPATPRELPDDYESPVPKEREYRAALNNIRLSAARGRSFGHQATPQTLETMVAKKDAALDYVLQFCERAGVAGSILREEYTEGAAPPPGDAARVGETPLTCDSCKHHRNGPVCEKLVSRPNRNGATHNGQTIRYIFGCTLHESASPVSAPRPPREED